ncbi:MAG: CHASE2 domain-containing protein [Bdellovibrionales bacterium]
MMKQLGKKFLSFLISPMAVGFYITMLAVFYTIQFYTIVNNPKSAGEGLNLAEWLITLHQKTVDARLQIRGPRAVDPNLALLTVDERSLATIGRWPWPRTVLAKAVDNAFQNGAKLLAFDMSFAEPSQNPAMEVLKQAELSNRSTSEFEGVVSALVPDLDNDKKLGEAFAKYSDKIVAGAFSNDIKDDPDWEGYMDFCLDLIFKMSPAAKQWDQEEVLVSPIDPFLPYVPGVLTEFFRDGVLAQRAAAVREKSGKPKNRQEEVLIEERVQMDLRETCGTMLDDFRDELNAQWQDVVLKNENPTEFKFKSYDEWLDNYKENTRKNSMLHAFTWTLNTPEIAKGTKHTGYFNTEQDPDGTIRRKALLVRTGQNYFPALSLKAFLVANDYNVLPKLTYSDVSFKKEVQEMDVNSNETGDKVFEIPTDGKGRLMLNYAGPQMMYPYLSFADLVSDSVDAEIEQRQWDPEAKRWRKQKRKVNKAEFIKDKIFVVGATATGIYDLRVTPFEENYPGAETHLNAIDNMIHRNFLKPYPDERVKMPVVLACVGFLLAVALTNVGALWGLIITAGSLAGTYYFDKYFIFGKGYVVAIVWPLFLISFLYMALTFYRYLTEERGKKELRQTFQKYVSPAIVEEILAHPKNIELGGKKTNLTVFFSDVRGFTTISEKLDPRALSDLLNSYLTPMTDIVFKNRGTLDKYMGDAIMAFFGAPISYSDHAKYACRCALLSLKKLFELQQEYEKKGLPTIDIGIGLNTGDVSVGNMGSETVRSYTVMGDAVNLASRLEGINKQYGTRIILSEMTYVDVKDSFVCREVDWVRVKGKNLPVKIYELVAEGKISDPKVDEMLKWFQEGYEFYHQKAWQDGLSRFSKALDIVPTDEVSKLYISRCQDYITEPPDDNWDGVFVMKTK